MPKKPSILIVTPEVTYLPDDLGNLAKLARKMLDQAGLKNVKITLAGNLDEYKIIKLK